MLCTTLVSTLPCEVWAIAFDGEAAVGSNRNCAVTKVPLFWMFSVITGLGCPMVLLVTAPVTWLEPESR